MAVVPDRPVPRIISRPSISCAAVSSPCSRVPILDAEAVDDPIDDDLLNPQHGIVVFAEVGRNRGDDVFESLLPAVRTKVVEAVRTVNGAIENLRGGRSHPPLLTSERDTASEAIV